MLETFLVSYTQELYIFKLKSEMIEWFISVGVKRKHLCTFELCLKHFKFIFYLDASYRIYFSICNTFPLFVFLKLNSRTPVSIYSV